MKKHCNFIVFIGFCILVAGGCGSGGNDATDTNPLPNETSVATEVPPSMSPTPTSTPTVSGPALVVGNVVAKAGDTVDVDVVLQGSRGVAGLQLDVRYDFPQIAVVATPEKPKEPHCWLSDRLVENDESLYTTLRDCGADGCSSMRAIIISFENNIITNGILFTCEITVSSVTKPGTYKLIESNQMLADSNGDIIDSSAVSGYITVVQ